MRIAVLHVELHIPYSHSLKEKRMVLRRVKDRLQKFNVADIDRLAPLHAAVDHRDRLRDTRPGIAGFGILAVESIDANVAKLTVEIAVVRAAAELAVGREPQADALLQRDRIPDRLVFRLRQRLPIDLAAKEFRPEVEQTLGTQQAADVFRAKRRLMLRQCFPPR